MSKWLIRAGIAFLATPLVVIALIAISPGVFGSLAHGVSQSLTAFLTLGIGCLVMAFFVHRFPVNPP